MTERSAERHRRLTHRALPALGVVAIGALAAGIAVGSLAESGSERAAKAFTRAWRDGDYAAMHALLTPAARARYGQPALRRLYAAAAATATETGVEVRDPRGEQDGRVRIPVVAHTRVFGPVRGTLLVPVDNGRVDWDPSLVFPGLDSGVTLTRRSRPPRRARILARDGQTLADGPAQARSSPLATLAPSIAGRLAPPESARDRRALYVRGFPPDWPVGQTGLERTFEGRLGGRPGGELLVGTRVLARARPRPGRAVRTTIDVKLQQAAVTALAGRLGGIAALDAGSGHVLALAGLAYSAPQPPGSTFKLVTTTAALEARAVKPSTPFPIRTQAVIDGVPLQNANGEACGGDFANSFAESCNSVFAPLGVAVGARRLVEVAERYGFNEPPTFPGVAPSVLPPADQITSPLEVGSTAIGQGRVLATPLQLASMSQTISAGGRRTVPSLTPGPRRVVRVTSRRVARTLRRLMLGVVAFGTGTAAAIPGVKVAGKTGTAELEDTRGPGAAQKPPGSDPSNTDAWFTAFAPAVRARIAVGVMLVRAGAGGQTAAPAARVVLAAGVGK